MVERILTDVLVVGGGAAAAMAAVEAAGGGAEVILADKGQFEASGTSPRGLDGLATTTAQGDSPELLFSDKLRCGYYLCNQNLMWAATQGAAENVRELEAIGYIFRKKADGDYDYMPRNLGQSVDRAVFYDVNVNGMNPVALLGKEAWRRGVKLLDHVMVVKLLRRGDSVAGALAIGRDGRRYVIQSTAVVLALGGANHLYPNPSLLIANRKFRTTGDAFFLAYDIGVPLIDMEFTGFRGGAKGKGGPLPNRGAWLFNARGERVMEKYAPEMLEKSPRGKMAEVISRENLAGRGPCYWELPDQSDERTHGSKGSSGRPEPERFEASIFYQRLMGGAWINEQAETTIPGLFAAGESAGGFHGADRSQSDSFLETTFFGRRAGRNAARFAKESDYTEPESNHFDDEFNQLGQSEGDLDAEMVLATTRNIMWEGVGVLRDASGIRAALKSIEDLRAKLPDVRGQNPFAALEAANLLLTAEMVARAALMREESRGGHVRTDFPLQDDGNWLTHVSIRNQDGKMVLGKVPVVTRS